jgi:Mn-dependent DtxR family transcriptional regulator
MCHEEKMLEQLLTHIAAGGIRSYTQLASELNVSEDLLTQMLEDLERMGYLRRIDSTCENRCQHCEMSRSCSVHDSGRIWTMTEKQPPKPL